MFVMGGYVERVNLKVAHQEIWYDRVIAIDYNKVGALILQFVAYWV